MATRTRAGRGDGRIFRLADGRWCAFIELERGPDGRRRRKKITASSRGQVVLKRDQVRAELARGLEPADERLTVGQLVELWLDHRTGKVADRTLANYRAIATKHVIATAVGRRPL
ncbi:MAG TPA: hypothetical protein VKV36_07415, partial [Acidimicrobiales bacterium]|nr:hypothetical protein [Acidimicrobiales bacterium]